MTDYGVYLIAQKVYLNIAKVYLNAQKVYLIVANSRGKCNDIIYITNISYINREGEFSLAVSSFKHTLKDKPKSKPFSYGINTKHPLMTIRLIACSVSLKMITRSLIASPSLRRKLPCGDELDGKESNSA